MPSPCPLVLPSYCLRFLSFLLPSLSYFLSCFFILLPFSISFYIIALSSSPSFPLLCSISCLTFISSCPTSIPFLTSFSLALLPSSPIVLPHFPVFLPYPLALPSFLPPFPPPLALPSFFPAFLLSFLCYGFSSYLSLPYNASLLPSSFSLIFLIFLLFFSSLRHWFVCLSHLLPSCPFLLFFSLLSPTSLHSLNISLFLPLFPPT